MMTKAEWESFKQEYKKPFENTDDSMHDPEAQNLGTCALNE